MSDIYSRGTGKFKPNSPIKTATKNGYSLRHTEMRYKYTNNKTDTDEESDSKDSSVKPLKSKSAVQYSHNVKPVELPPENVEPVKQLSQHQETENLLRPVARSVSGRKSKSNSPSRSGLFTLCSLLCVMAALLWVTVGCTTENESL